MSDGEKSAGQRRPNPEHMASVILWLLSVTKTPAGAQQMTKPGDHTASSK